jgi:hypothetical protein
MLELADLSPASDAITSRHRVHRHLSRITYLRFPEWDRRLLQHVKILDGDALMDYFLTAATLHVVSDGGADDDRGSYGALLA